MSEAVERAEIVRSLLERSRLLDDAQFRVVRSVYEEYVREAFGPTRVLPPPVAAVAEEGRYALSVPAGRKPLLSVSLRLRVFSPDRCAGLPVLSAAWAWEDVRVNGEPAQLATEKGWLRLSPAAAGEWLVSARLALREVAGASGSLDLAIPRTVRTLASFESPEPWEVAVGGAVRGLRGGPAGTRGELALPPTERLRIAYGPVLPATERPPRFALRGDVAWNIDTALQQVSAELDVWIGGGAAEVFVLALSPAAERLSISGPDVREVHPAPGKATVFLRGRVAERTRLRVSYEAPLAKEGVQRLDGLAVEDGHWAGGTLVVSNAAGGIEVLPGTLSGLRQMAFGDLPASARALAVGTPALACEIAGRTWAAEAELLDLADFALKESIADLAHYELLFRADGMLLCKASYEVRNRARQFLRLDLPRGATVLQARVNEEPRPLTPVPGAPDAYLLPLVRSLASVQGLVTFPVDVVFMCRLDAVGGASVPREGAGPGTRRGAETPRRQRKGELALPLPRIDLPVAYAWCQAYMPEGMKVSKWAGPLARVERYSNETATATMSYGLGMAAEGYRPAARPVPRPAPPEEKPPSPEPPAKTPVPTPQDVPVFTIETSEPDLKLLLGRNYYRAGKDFYEKGDLASAASNLEQAIALNPRSQEAYNAAKLLDNIRLVQPGQAGAGPIARSQSERAAGIQVKKHLKAGLRSLEQQQQEYVERGIQAAREGKGKDAQAQFKAAEALGEQLIAQGASKEEVESRLRVAQNQLRYVRDQDVAEAKELYKSVREHKKAGRYEEALRSAQRLLQYDVGGRSRIQHEIDQLALQAARDRVAKGVAMLSDGKDRPAQQLEDLREAIVTERVRPPAPRPETQDKTDAARGQVQKRLEDLREAIVRERVQPPAPRPETQDETVAAGGGFRAFDVSDLIIESRGPQKQQQALAAGRGYAPQGGQAAAQDFFADEDGDGEKDAKLTGEGLVGFIKKSIAPGTWADGPVAQDGERREYTITYRDGQIVTVHTPEVQRQVSELLESVRKARGPQVELGQQIALQRASGKLQHDDFVAWSLEANKPAATERQPVLWYDQNPQFQRFVARNYAWQFATLANLDGQQIAIMDSGPASNELVWNLAERLGFNLGQKVQVNGINLNVDAAEANGIGVTFATGNNDLSYAVVDEAQLRTLLELDAAKKRGRVAARPNAQETIVGTDALLPNDMRANVRFAGDASNTLDIAGNPIALPHQKYILIDNGTYLTAVQANPMQHWTEPLNPFPFLVAAPELEVPRVGRLVKFEKTLVEPGDELVLRASYRYRER